MEEEYCQEWEALRAFTSNLCNSKSMVNVIRQGSYDMGGASFMYLIDAQDRHTISQDGIPLYQMISRSIYHL
eukprot:14894392-Ditylum_brightwellii.AAC.1